MENMNNYNKESLLTEISVSKDILFMNNEFNSFEQNKKELINLFIKIFKVNGFLVNEQFILKYFEHSINLISESLKDNSIKSNKDLKFYIENELYLNISNTEYLWNNIFNKKYMNVQNFLFVNE